MSLAPVRAKKKETEQAIAQILLEFSREAQQRAEKLKRARRYGC